MTTFLESVHNETWRTTTATGNPAGAGNPVIAQSAPQEPRADFATRLPIFTLIFVAFIAVAAIATARCVAADGDLGNALAAFGGLLGAGTFVSFTVSILIG